MRVPRAVAPTHQAYVARPSDPPRPRPGRDFAAIRVPSLHLREVHQLARVRRVLAAHDDDRVHLLGELARSVLALNRYGADRVEDLRFLRDLRNMRDELLERPRRLR